MKPAVPGLGLAGLIGLSLLTACGTEDRAAQFADGRRDTVTSVSPSAPAAPASPTASPSTSPSMSPTTSPTTSSTPQTFTMPDVVGKDGRDAFNTMRGAGYLGRSGAELRFQSEDAERVFVIKNWTVTRQSAAAGSIQGVREEITLTARK
ncbi:PASTA domain-containing protein [Spirillospora sp. NPDC047279]|uniref:PASTA domain-containing protein n=1 Tax=Spirillospora sp. NPDC047279 TaxID=3155478 RepID=UPI0033E4D18E